MIQRRPPAGGQILLGAQVLPHIGHGQIGGRRVHVEGGKAHGHLLVEIGGQDIQALLLPGVAKSRHRPYSPTPWVHSQCCNRRRSSPARFSPSCSPENARRPRRGWGRRRPPVWPASGLDTVLSIFSFPQRPSPRLFFQFFIQAADQRDQFRGRVDGVVRRQSGSSTVWKYRGDQSSQTR